MAGPQGQAAVRAIARSRTCKGGFLGSSDRKGLDRFTAGSNREDQMLRLSQFTTGSDREELMRLRSFTGLSDQSW